MARARRSVFGGLGWVPLLFVAAFGAATLMLLTLLAHGVAHRWRIRTALSTPKGGQEDGRRRFEGNVGARGPEIRAPSGATAPGYHAEIGRYERSGKSRNYVTVCARTELGGVALVELGGTERPLVDLLGQGPTTALGRASSPEFGDEAPRLLAPLEGEGPPPARMLELCGLSAGDGLVYGERLFRPGEGIEAIACVRGERVEPCRDGYDLVTLVPMESFDDDDGFGTALIALFVSGWVTMSVGFGGFAVARRIPRAKREGGPA